MEHPKAQQEVVIDKPEIEPGLQGIVLIHYTMVASDGIRVKSLYAG